MGSGDLGKLHGEIKPPRHAELVPSHKLAEVRRPRLFRQRGHRRLRVGWRGSTGVLPGVSIRQMLVRTDVAAFAKVAVIAPPAWFGLRLQKLCLCRIVPTHNNAPPQNTNPGGEVVPRRRQVIGERSAISVVDVRSSIDAIGYHFLPYQQAEMLACGDLAELTKSYRRSHKQSAASAG